MVQFHKVEVPRLRIPQKNQPMSQYGSKFDVGTGPVGTTRSDLGIYSPVKRKEGKIPGYSGHLPLVSEGHVIGRSFGFLSRLETTEPQNLLQSALKVAVPGDLLRLEPPHTARDSAFTIAENRVLTAKFRNRDLGGEDRLRDLRLKVTPRAQTARTEKSLRSVQDIERHWMKLHVDNTRTWQAPDTSRTIPPPLDRPASAAGRIPDRNDATWQVCADFLRSQKLGPQLFDTSLDSIFPDHGPSTGWSCGELYEIPKGWNGFGLKIPDWAERKQVFSKWITSFYPCPPEHLETILRTGSLVIPGDHLLDGTKSKTVFLAQNLGVEKSDPNTPRKDRCTTRVYTTPSIQYARMKLAALTRNGGYEYFQGKRISIVLQCKQMGGAVRVGGYQKCGETIGWGHQDRERGARIWAPLPNSEIEMYSLQKSAVLPYRLLLKVEEQELSRVVIPNSGGEMVTGPAMAYKDVKWMRSDQPPFGAMSLPGLTLPYQDFSEVWVDKDVRAGGLECAKPRGPFLAFPESAAVRDKDQDPTLRPSTQPTEPEAMVLPSKGWLEGLLPPSLKQIDTRKNRTVSGVLTEMKDKFSACASSLKVVFDRLAAANNGQLQPEQLAKILQRLNIVRRLDDPILEEVWQTLDEDSGGSVSIDELVARFGLVGKSDNLLENFRRKIGGRFKLMRAAFREVDADHSGTVDKRELRNILLHFNLLRGVEDSTYDELWGALDRDKSGSIDYVEFVEKFAGQAGNLVAAYGNQSGTKVEARRSHTTPGSTAHTVAALCDEGTACYAQMDYASAEHKYREALRLDPRHVLSLCSLAWLLRNTKNDVLGSRGLLQRAAEIDPQHPYVVMQRDVY